jgi:hypothetical protein
MDSKIFSTISRTFTGIDLMFQWEEQALKQIIRPSASQSKQIRLTFRRSLPIAISHVCLALLVAVELQGKVADIALQWWLGVMLLLQLLWMGMGVAHNLSERRQQGNSRWMPAHCAITSLIGLAWGGGAAAALLYGVEPMAQVLLIAVVAGVAAGSLIIHTFSYWGGAVYIGAVLLPVALVCLTIPGSSYLILAILLPLYAWLLIQELRQFGIATQSVLSLSQDNAELQLEAQAFRTFFTQAQQLAHFGNWELDLKSGALHWSDEAFALFGIEPQPLTKEVVLKNIYGADRVPYVRALEQALAETGIVSREFRGIPGMC